MNTLKLRFDILDETRRQLLDQLIPLTNDFVLAGGTALALQIGHRKSFDFDFFSLNDIPNGLLEKFAQFVNVESVAIDNHQELTLFCKDHIKVTLLNYPFASIYQPFVIDKGLRIFPYKEIAIQKAYTIGRRGEYRDYFDLFTLLQKPDINLSQIIQDANHKYQNLFNAKLFLEQLIYFDDLLNLEIIPLDDTVPPSSDEVKKILQHEVKTFLASDTIQPRL